VNTNSVKIAVDPSSRPDPTSTHSTCRIQLAGDRTFTINNNGGGAAVDLIVEAFIVNKDYGPASGLVKAGNGTLQLTPIWGTNYYTGATTINAGKLLMDGVLKSGGGAVTVNDGGTLGGTGVIWRAITVASNATLSAGNSGAPATLATTNLTLNEGAIIACDAAGGAMDQVVVNGTLTLPTNATVNVSQTGAFPSPAVLFSATSLAGAPSLSGWRLTPPGLSAAISGNSVILQKTPGSTILIR
jgi:autotransporter-associated beta strand protein